MAAELTKRHFPLLFVKAERDKKRKEKTEAKTRECN